MTTCKDCLERQAVQGQSRCEICLYAFSQFMEVFEKIDDELSYIDIDGKLFLVEQEFAKRRKQFEENNK